MSNFWDQHAADAPGDGHWREPPRKVGAWEDMARGGLAGLVQGAVSLAAMPADLNAALTHGAGWLAEKFGMSHEQAVKMIQVADAMRRANPNPMFGGGPTSAEAMQQFGHVAPGVNYRPQTVPGQYARTVGQFAPAALGPGSALTRAANVLIPALASETAGQVTKGSKYEGVARLVAALGVGAVTNLVTGPKGSDRVIANAADGATPDELARATDLAKTGQRVGVPLSTAEAIQTTAPQTRMAQMAQDVETSEQGAPLRALYAQRPAQVQQAGTALLDQIAPPGDPIAIGLRGQSASEGALRALESDRTAAVNPAYTAAGPQMVPANEVVDLVGAIRDQAAKDRTGLISGKLLQLAQTIWPEGSNAPITDVENLDRIRKFYRDKMSLPPGSTDALPREVGGAVGGFMDWLGSILEQVPEFASGKAQYQQFSRAVVDPALSGPLGKIQGTTEVGAQTGALFPNIPPEGQAAVTAQALKRLDAAERGPTPIWASGQARLQKPSISADLTRQYFARALAEQTQGNVGGPNQWGGAKFAGVVAGNPIQRDTLMSAIGEAAPQAEGSTKDLLDVLGATGTRLRPGSTTAEKLAAASDVAAGESTGVAVVAHASPRMMIDRALRWANDIAQAGNRERLAQFLTTDPENYGKLIGEAQARYAAGRLGARELRALLFNLEGARVSTRKETK